MHTMYEKVVSVVAKPVEDRTDIECMDLVAWFRNKSSLFQSLKAGKDKYCGDSKFFPQVFFYHILKDYSSAVLKRH
uniref:Uncharacterized protein n=1 Tax=Magallana gigas TaxID=29159 RepID=K1PIM5_MAGGI